MGKASKRKGDKAEREIIKLLGGQRTFWQPENGETTRGDIIDAPYLGRGEVKIRKDGFKQLYNWLADNDFLAVRADRKEWLIIQRVKDVKLLTNEMDELKQEKLQEG